MRCLNSDLDLRKERRCFKAAGILFKKKTTG